MNITTLHSTELPGMLTDSALFQGVDFTLIASELGQSHPFDVEAGHVLLDPDRVNHDIYVILDGELLVCLEPLMPQPLVRLRVGDCVGELSIIDARVPSAYVVAAVKTRLLTIAKPVLWQMLANQPVMALNLLHVLSQRIRENNVVLLSSIELQRAYRSKAESDGLTGLHNRSWFQEVFPKQLELCERTGQQACLLMLDIDHFKRVNDDYGHLSGDQALRHIASVLRSNLRSTDLCARYGGEEIVVLMPGSDLLQAQPVAERLRQGVANAPLVLADGRALELKVSGGLAQWQPGTTLDDLVRSADQALYEAKSSGRNRIMTSLLIKDLRASQA
ncbi:MAG: GGDEF domain-containing protein [Comamonadaceae bacterium CG12_big_fil_rev_8_21_14_0_65_59_15]|nr:MAG: GGDEF domain-containing protein [Comamonadaceae bacterium CG12_big_fil_rev_8_21_14_0_65_59_15]